MKWKLKLDGDGNPVFEDGKLVLVDEDGNTKQESPSDLLKRLAEASGEAASRRHSLREEEQRREALEAEMKRWKALGDPEEIAKLLESARKAETDELVSKGEYEAALAKARETHQTEIERLQKEAADKSEATEAEAKGWREAAEHYAIDNRLTAALAGKVRGGEIGLNMAVKAIRDEGVVKLEGEGRELQAFVEAADGRQEVSKWAAEHWLKTDTGKLFAEDSKAVGGAEKPANEGAPTSGAFDAKGVKSLKDLGGDPSKVAAFAKLHGDKAAEMIGALPQE